MGIRQISYRVDMFGHVVLQLEEDFYYGHDMNGMPISLCTTRVRDVEVQDLGELGRLGVFGPVGDR